MIDPRAREQVSDLSTSVAGLAAGLHAALDRIVGHRRRGDRLAGTRSALVLNGEPDSLLVNGVEMVHRHIDDIAFTGLANTPFTTLVPNAGVCTP